MTDKDQKYQGIPAAPRKINMNTKPMQGYAARMRQATYGARAGLEIPKESHVSQTISKPFSIRQKRSK